MLLREKRMTHHQSLAYQDAFEHLFGALQAPKNLALFMRRDPENPDSYIVLVAGQTDRAEQLSPGEWQDAAEPHAHTWTHLVGHDGIGRHYGLELGD